MKKITVGQKTKIEGLYRKVIAVKENWALLENHIGTSEIAMSYDVVRKNTLEEDRDICGNITPKGSEFLSKSSSWGADGFTFKEKAIAEKVFNSSI